MAEIRRIVLLLYCISVVAWICSGESFREEDVAGNFSLVVEPKGAKVGTGGQCLSPPRIIYLQPGQQVVLQSPNYPQKYPAFSKCSWKIQGYSGTKLSMKCDPVKLSLFANLYAEDIDHTERISCVLCLGAQKFNYDFKSNYGTVGLHNAFLFGNTGFSCIVESALVNIPGGLCKCGLPNLGSSRILNGLETVPNKYPWMAAFVYALLPFKADCSGSLISDRFVLTAASCTYKNKNNNNYKVRLGVHDLVKSPSHAMLLPILEHFFPQEYIANAPDGNVALARIQSINFYNHLYSVNVRPLCLYNYNQDLIGVNAVVAGWGNTNLVGGRPSKLRETTVDIISNQQCQSLYPNTFTNNMMCAGTKDSNHCEHDTGAPLMGPSTRGGYKLLIGVAGEGYKCGLNKPRLNTRFSVIRHWVKNIMISRGAQTCQYPA